MVQIVGLNLERRNAHGPRKVILISDLLQNTSELNFYRDVPDYAVFRARPEAARLHSKLKGVTVVPQVLMNSPQLQTRRLLKFWEDYFGDMGATVPDVQLLPG